LEGENWEEHRLKQLGTAALLSIVQSLSQLLSVSGSNGHDTPEVHDCALMVNQKKHARPWVSLEGENWEEHRLKQLGTAALLSIVQSLSQLLSVSGWNGHDTPEVHDCALMVNQKKHARP